MTSREVADLWLEDSGLEPTKGERQKARRQIGAAVAFERWAGASDHVRGRVRLTTAENLANSLLIPVLPTLRIKHPELTVEIATDIRSANRHRREADLALRLVRPTQGGVLIKREGTMRYELYGSADYLACSWNMTCGTLTPFA